MIPLPISRAARTAPVHPTPRAAVAARSLRMPAFWVLSVLLLVGAVRIGWTIRGAFDAYPLATGAAVGLFGLYAVPFLIFIDRIDYLEREPPVLLATAFTWGAVVATAAAIPGNAALDDLAAKWGSPAFAASWGPALAGPTVEEPLKLLGVVMIVLVAREQMNSLVDGFVYGAVVGLGFQVVEDMLYAANDVAAAGTGDHVAPVIGTLVGRGFVAGLWSHTLFTALAGTGVAYAVVRRRDRSRRMRLSVAALCLAGAWACHFAWNSPLLADGFGLGWPGQLLAGLVKGVPVLVAILALLWTAGHREADYYAAVLARLSEPRLATAEEIAALRSPGRRAAARRAAAERYGRPGLRATSGLQAAQARLAVELSRGGPAEEPEGPVAYWRERVLTARQRLAALDDAQPRRTVVPDAVMWLAGSAVVASLAFGLALVLRALH
jgi:RsiW-degrading membrane proteinase PrsW (M82 family)